MKPAGKGRLGKRGIEEQMNQSFTNMATKANQGDRVAEGHKPARSIQNTMSNLPGQVNDMDKIGRYGVLLLAPLDEIQNL